LRRKSVKGWISRVSSIGFLINQLFDNYMMPSGGAEVNAIFATVGEEEKIPGGKGTRPFPPRYLFLLALFSRTQTDHKGR
jgi:hypothetical protein